MFVKYIYDLVKDTILFVSIWSVQLKFVYPQSVNKYLNVSFSTSQWRLSVRPSNVAGTSQMKHPTTSRWNVAKTSQWCVSTTSYWNVITTSQKDVTTTPHHYVSTTSQTSLKWNTQKHCHGMSPPRLGVTFSRRLVSRSLLHIQITLS